MASLSDKLAANMNLSAVSKAEDLQKRILFTLALLIVYRLGTFIPLPGIDANVLGDIFQQNSSGIIGMFDMFAGGALSRMSIFALNIMPYISASIIMQLCTAVFPNLATLKKEGESGYRKINQYTRYLTVLITILQGYGIAVGLEAVTSSTGASAVINPGWLFRFTSVVSLLGGTMFIVWLGDQITSRGIGNGSSLIITIGIICGIPSGLAMSFELVRVGQLSPIVLLAVLVMAIALIFVVVLVERAQRRIIIQYPKRQMGGRMFAGESSQPMTVFNLSARSEEASDWVTTLTTVLSHGQPVYLILYTALIVFFSFFYAAVVFNPEDTAENLKRHGGFIAGIRPGKSTADYLDYVMTRLLVFGSAYLAALCVLPEILIAKVGIPFVLGGTTLLIVVSVTIDFVTQVQSHLIAHQYEGLIKKAKLKGRL